ncbi:hypothetical protein FUU19_07060 [Serratia sp. Lou2A]|uniref:Lipid A core - O-antigen ligase and related enzymes n=1 Tax=Serratia montpellierensis TaxID=2598730 RepID=A0ABS8J618_9GAMM|nr:MULTISPECIES: hypothetical protein [unclassified Serratia (in: enterobacteria)]MCC7583283.1 hypothetical protein [Serratia sp. Lou2A]MCC7659451.1 hypothetical protein [Serratia sp. Pon4B]
MYITRKNFTPQNVFLFTSCVSFLAWVFPSLDFLRKGFSEPYPLLSLSGLAYPVIIFFFYGVIWVGYHIIPVVNDNQKDTSSALLVNYNVYFASAIISFFGILATTFIISKSISVSDIISIYSAGKANAIKEGLYEDYSLGLVSLRYCVILSGSFAIYRRLMGEKNLGIDIFSLSSLIVVSMISSRLTLIAGVFGGLYLYIYTKKTIRIKSFKIIFIGGVVFLVLSALNWSRNSNFYEEKGLGFMSAGFSEILAYVGTPVQGALYAISNPDVGKQSYMQFYNESTIESALTTNSAILDVIRMFGVQGLLFAAVILFFSGLYISFFEKLKSGKYIYCNIAVFYSIAEFWRIFLFFQGIIITLISVSLLLAFFSRVRFRKVLG